MNSNLDFVGVSGSFVFYCRLFRAESSHDESADDKIYIRDELRISPKLLMSFQPDLESQMVKNI